MVANGVTRARLPADNEVICTLDDPRVAGARAASSAPPARPPRWNCGATASPARSSPSATRRRRCSACSKCSTTGAPQPGRGDRHSGRLRRRRRIEGRRWRGDGACRSSSCTAGAAAARWRPRPSTRWRAQTNDGERRRHGRLYRRRPRPGRPGLHDVARALRSCRAPTGWSHFCQARAGAATRATIADAVVARRSGARDRARLPGHDRDRRRATRPMRRRSPPSTTRPPSGSPRDLDAGRSRRGALRGRPVLLRLVHASVAAARAALSRPRSCPASPACRAAGRAPGAPIAWGDDVLTVLPGTLPEAELARRLARHRRGRDHEARPQPAEGARGARRRPGCSTARSMSSAAPWRTSVICRSPRRRDDEAPYFSMILVPGEGGGCERAAR